MVDKNIWESDEVLETLKKRGLDATCPPQLKSYLRPGLHVLDVGCGPGPVTLDVAREVHPGSVVGVDIGERLIEEATALSEKLQVDNATFHVGDAGDLEFADDTFDLSYSNWVIGYLRDPIAALREQKRVTKPGGWVVAATGEWATRVIYPPCPAYETWWAAIARYSEITDDKDMFFNGHWGRRVIELFSEAGLTDIKVDPWGLCKYPGEATFDSTPPGPSRHLSLEGAYGGANKRLIEAGAFDEETLRTAQSELDAWHAHPHAFRMDCSLLAAGRA